MRKKSKNGFGEQLLNYQYMSTYNGVLQLGLLLKFRCHSGSFWKRQGVKSIKNDKNDSHMEQLLLFFTHLKNVAWYYLRAFIFNTSKLQLQSHSNKSLKMQKNRFVQDCQVSPDSWMMFIFQHVLKVINMQ